MHPHRQTYIKQAQQCLANSHSGSPPPSADFRTIIIIKINVTDCLLQGFDSDSGFGAENTLIYYTYNITLAISSNVLR